MTGLHSEKFFGRTQTGILAQQLELSGWTILARECLIRIAPIE